MTLIKGKYRIFSEQGTYDIVHFETDSDQVVTSDNKQFVSKTEKEIWSSKSDAHGHPYRLDTWVPSWSEILSKPSFANVATSGSYNDLSNKPTIPTNASFTFAGLSDTTITSATVGQLIKFDGSKWVNWTPNFLTSHLVTSVAGKVGDIVLSKADVGLEKVDNTSDVEKQVKTAKTLETARTINGVSFDGSKNINVPSIAETSSQAPANPVVGQIWIDTK